MVGLNNPGADRQPKTCALLGMSARVIGAIESIEDPRLILLRNPDSVIGHGHSDVRLIDRHCDIDGACGVESILIALSRRFRNSSRKRNSSPITTAGAVARSTTWRSAFLPQERGLPVKILDKRVRSGPANVPSSPRPYQQVEKQQLIHNACHPVDFFRDCSPERSCSSSIARGRRSATSVWPFMTVNGVRNSCERIAAELADLPKGGFKPIDHVIKRVRQAT